MRKRELWRGDKRFWSPIAIGSGLTIFFVGIATVPNNTVRGWFTIGFGLLLLILGFCIAPIKEASSQEKDRQPDKQTIPGNPIEPSHREAEYQMYREERKTLLEALLDQSRSFDKYILTMAAGTFGLSFLFIQQITPEPKPETMVFLITAWGSFAASILTTLLSFLLSQKACLKQIEILDSWCIQEGEERPEPVNIYTIVTQWLNWFSMLIFVSGVILLIIFGGQNIFP